MKIQVYKTIRHSHELELKEKKSVFLAKVYPVNNESEADNILTDLKKKYHDASHHCYAYRLISGKSKFSDAGEPSGTAGIRILNAIDHYEFQNCLVVIIRYFGGTKLGIGPLGKAYYSSAVNVLSKTESIIKQLHYQIELRINIKNIDKLISFLYSNKIKVEQIEYDLEVKINCLFPVESYESLRNKIIDSFREIASFSKKDEIIFD